MALFGLLNRKPSREGTKPSSTPVDKTNWTSFKSKLSRRKEQPTMLSKPFINAREPSETSRNEPHHREPNLLWKSVTPHPAVTSPPPSTMQPRSSADNQSLGSRAESSGSSRPFTQDSIASSSLSKYNYIFFAPLRASMLGETGSAEHEARPVDSQEDGGAGCEAGSSQPDAPISPLGHAAPEAAVRSVEGIERSPMREYEPACALESFIAMSPYGGDDISTCLRGGTAAQARRIRNAFRSQHTHRATTSCERVKEFLAHQSFNTLSATDSSEKDAQPGNTKKNESASGEGKPSLTVAPINLNPLSLEKPTQAIRPFKAVGSAGNHCQPVDKHEDESAGSEANPSRAVAPNFPITSSRQKCIRVPALAPILELVSEDDPELFNASSSLRVGDQRHCAPLQSQVRARPPGPQPGSQDRQISISSQNLIDQTFGSENHKSSRATRLSKNEGEPIDTEGNDESASGGAPAPRTVAPINSTRLLHQQSTQASTSDTFGTNGSTGNDRQTVDRGDNESAGPSLAAAPITSIPLSRLKPRKVVKPAAPPVWSQVSQHTHRLRSCIASKLRQWGMAVSSVLRVRPPAEFGATGGQQSLQNGHSVVHDTKPWAVDPWKGYVPPSESSLQIEINYGLADPRPGPTNTRVKIE